MLIEAWVSIGIGVIVLFMFPTMASYLSSKVFHTHFGPYAAYDSADNPIVDKNGNQQTSEVVTYFDSAGNLKQVVYRQTKPNVAPNFYNDLVISLFALAMLIEGAALILSRHPAVIAAAIAVTLAAVLANLVFFLTTYTTYGLPIMSALAVVVGGYMAFSQFALLKWRLATARPIRELAVRAQRPQADPAKELVQKVLGGDAKPRCIHYRFATQALLKAAEENPARCVGLLQSAGAQNFLNELWQAVRTGCESSGQVDHCEPDGLSAEMTQVGPYSAAIVTMPAPKVAAEAHFIAVVLRSFIRDSDGLTISRHPLLLYYTLERGPADAGGPPATVIGQWEGTTHLSHGPGPNPTASAFRDALRSKVAALEARENAITSE